MTAPDFELIGGGTDGLDPIARGLAHLLHARCCTSLDDDAATARMNLVNPTGIASPWSLCTDGNKAPVQCADDPARRHLMFSC